MKDKKIFKKFTIIYFSILAILSGCFIYYVVDSLIKYENSDIEKYIAKLVVDISKDAKRNKIDNYIDIKDIKVSELETSNTSVSEGYSNIFKTKDITYKLVEGTIDSTPTYEILADGELLFTIKLKSNGDVHRMGLLTFPDWQIEDVTLPNDRGLYYYDLYVLDGYKVTINGKELDLSKGTKADVDNELVELSKFTDLPTIISYELNNLTTDPDIKVYDFKNKEINFEKYAKEIKAYELFTTDDVTELKDELVADIDVLEIGEMWSKFLTDDLAGTYHGYSTIKNYLIEETELWNMAYEWSHGVDITFVSGHTLVGFDNEKVSNCEVYNDKAFSCEIYLEKNMRLRSGKAKQDIMHDRFYFVYYENTWKLVSMKAITEN